MKKKCICKSKSRLLLRFFLIFLLFSSNELFAQSNKLIGTVKDEKGLPLQGVNVILKGSTAGTTTNLEGAYSIAVNENAVLNFSSVGFITKEVNVKKNLLLNIQLVAATGALTDVIVVAYGSTTKKTATGALQTINTKDLMDVPVAQITQKLQGKFAGVQITQTTGKPGQGMSVKIRGQVSLAAGSDPLYVVDGFPITGDLATINPDEIESVTVLKDAASTSLYGSRAANGVVLITTIHAKAGQSSVGANAYYGFQKVPEKGKPNMMNATEFAQFKKESAEDLGVPVPVQFQNPSQYGAGNNWYNAML